MAAGAFHPDHVKAAVVSQLAAQLLVAAADNSELTIVQQSSLLVDDGGVVVRRWGIDAERTAGWADTPVTSLVASSYQVTPAHPVACSSCGPTG